jgi:hypothetical protein
MSHNTVILLLDELTSEKLSLKLPVSDLAQKMTGSRQKNKIIVNLKK